MKFEEFIKELPLDLNLEGHDKEIQLLKLYAYNQFFNADPNNTEDVNEGCTYFRTNGMGVDGVYLNQNSLENDAVEIIYSDYISDDVFSIESIGNIFLHLYGMLKQVSDGKFISNNKNAENRISDFLQDLNPKNAILRIITNYTPTPSDKKDYLKVIGSLSYSISGINVSAEILFGDDIEDIIDSNKAPYAFVDSDKLVLDDPSNLLVYKNDSIICNVSAKSLQELWKKEGKRGLLAMNLRYYVKHKDIDANIEESIQYNADSFWYLNNGLIIVCDDYYIKDNELRLVKFSIVNGGQTTRMIGETYFEKDFFICCKVVKNNFESENDKNTFIASVAEATNTQKPIKPKDVIANKIEQRNLKSNLAQYHVFVEVKRGDKCDKNIHKEAWQRTKNNEIAQDIYSFVYLQPGPARQSVSDILSSNEKYNKIFGKRHIYNNEFLIDIIKLEKAYKEYQKIKKKDESVDYVTLGLISNCMYYCLATLGYLLKLIYNKEYKSDISKNKNNENICQPYAEELAFNHPFNLHSDDFKSLCNNLFDVFDLIFSEHIKPQFIIAKGMKPDLAYSNWTKTNTGFEDIKRRINSILFETNGIYILNEIKKYFVAINPDKENQNIDEYEGYLKSNKAVQKVLKSGGASPEDDVLRQSLLLLRQQHALQNGIIDETDVFTDAELANIVLEKPTTIKALKKIITNSIKCFKVGNDVIDIVNKIIQ